MSQLSPGKWLQYRLYIPTEPTVSSQWSSQAVQKFKGMVWGWVVFGWNATMMWVHLLISAAQNFPAGWEILASLLYDGWSQSHVVHFYILFMDREKNSILAKSGSLLRFQSNNLCLQWAREQVPFTSTSQQSSEENRHAITSTVTTLSHRNLCVPTQ